MADPAERGEGAEWVEPDLSAVVTEDDAPVDNIFSEKQQRLLTAPLYDSWPGRRDESGRFRPFVAMSNVGLFFQPDEAPVVPDALLSADVSLPSDLWPKKHRSYFVWQYGKPPDVVIEIVSNREGGELDDKLRIYEHVRVAHYVVFDPIQQLGGPRLRAFELRGDRYVDRLDLRFERLGLALVEWEGPWEGRTERWLRWAEVGGLLIPSGAERAEQEKQRAEQEKQRAEQEKQRADRLAEKLRALGVDPDDA